MSKKFNIRLFLLPLSLFFLSIPLYGQSEITIPRHKIQNKDVHEAYTPSFENDAVHKPVKNVILMIGDGMGLPHISAAMYANGGYLTMTNLRTVGLVRTQSADAFTTDSAASGTAYATGEKTTNGTIGMNPEGKPLANLTERLSALGYATGVLTTDNMEGATPSSFFAHQPKRNMAYEILGELSKSKLDFFAGGSKEQTDKIRPEMWKELKKAGFTVVGDVSEKGAEKAKRLGVLPEDRYVASVNDDRGDYLPRTTAFALDYLSKKSEKGFFIMIEASRVDKSAHENNIKGVVGEVFDFDKAIEAAVRFAEKNGETLVIISADHETGGMAIHSNGNPEKGEVRAYFTSKGHTPIMVPLFAYGPWSDMFKGVQENSDVSNKIYEILSR